MSNAKECELEKEVKALKEKVEALEKQSHPRVHQGFITIFTGFQRSVKALESEIDKLRSDNHNVLASHLESINILRKTIDRRTITLSDRLVDSNSNTELVKTVLDNYFGYILRKYNKLIEKIEFEKTIQAFRDQLKGSYVVSRKAVEEYINEEKVQCPKCMNTNLERFDRSLRCRNCGYLFTDKPIEGRTELRIKVEGLTFHQLKHRAIQQRGTLPALQDSLIYIHWLFREIISDLQFYINNTDLESGQKLIKKYEKLFKK